MEPLIPNDLEKILINYEIDSEVGGGFNIYHKICQEFLTAYHKEYDYTSIVFSIGAVSYVVESCLEHEKKCSRGVANG